MAEQWRLFIALPLTKPVRERVHEAQVAARETGLDARWVAPNAAHLTLKFLGDTDPALVGRLAGRLRETVAAHRRFFVRVGQLGAFPNAQRPRVLWLGLDGDLAPLYALQDAIEVALAPLGFPRETRPFRPHLTLGRLRERGPVPARGALRSAQVALGTGVVPLPATEALLVRSELGRDGARYTTLGTFALAREA